MATQYIVHTSFAAAQARSRAQALANGCRPGDVTQYWWPVMGGAGSAGGVIAPGGISALLVIDGSFYSTQGLNGAEQSALQTAAQLGLAGWTLPP